MLEGLASRLAAERIDEAGLARLRELHREHRAAVAAGDVEGHYDADADFHAAIRSLAASPRLSSDLEMLQGQIRLAMHTTHRSPGGMARALDEHTVD